MMKQLSLLLVFFICTINLLSAEIKVIDSKTNEVHFIRDASQVNRFNYFWSQKQPYKKQQPFQWRYQFTINSQTGTSSWVYDPNGYAREVSMQHSSVIFQLSPIRSFNRFLIKDK